MSCALKLLEAGRDFLLVTDNLGGRILYSEKAKVNFGAYFVMGNYFNALKIVDKDTLLKPTSVCFHNSDTERFSVLSMHTLRRLPEFLRFYLAMREFASHYEPYKQRCLTMSQKEALDADPFIADLFSKTASEFIREKRYEKVADDYVSKFTYACTGVGTDRLTALDFLNVSMGLLVPINRFAFDSRAMAEKLGAHLVTDAIIRIEDRENKRLLIGKSGRAYLCESVVVATPAVVTKELLGLSAIRESCRIYVFHVRAELKTVYRKYAINLLPSSSEVMLTARQFDGSHLIYTRESATDLHQVCDSFELMTSVAWENAMYVHGSAYIEQQYGDNVHVAGDHNGLGLEPAAISGIYAANRIMAKSGTVNK